MPLNDKQQEAVDYLEGPLLVLAGPGTGKTQLLSSKVAYILEHTDATPENILCITYTDAATANMRDRLTGMIGMAAHHVNIFTYHSFGTDILRQYGNYADTYTRSMEGAIDEVAAHKIISKLQKKLKVDDPLRANSVKEIKETISMAKKARLTPDDLVKIGKDNQKSGAEFTPAISELIVKLKTEKIRKYDMAVNEIYQPILEILADYITKEPIAGQIMPLANVMTIELKAAIEEGQDGGNGKATVKPLTRWLNRYFEAASDENYRLKDHVANLKLASVAQIYQEYQAYLMKNGLYDFDDMIEEAIKVLSEDQGFRLSLAEKYQYIMLDEFQDTNSSQFEIIRLLTDYEKPILMAVGDDDQTIFEFQGARPDNLVDFQTSYNAKVINLSENYRSTTEIVDFGRAIATQIPDSFEKTMGVKKALTAALDKGKDAQSHIERREFDATDYEYAWIAQEIKKLITAGEDPAEIGIITPQHKYIEPLLPYLKEQEIPIAYEKSGNILAEQKIQELMTLARFVYDLSRTEQPAYRLLEILSYDFWEIPAIDVVQQIEKGKVRPTLDYLLTAKSQPMQRAGEVLAELVKQAANTPLEQFLDYVIGVIPLKDSLCSPFLGYYERDDNVAFDLYNNLLTLREKMMNYLKNVKRPTLADLVEFLDDYEAAEMAIVTTSPYQDDDKAVQIMTVHKSKGLEFKRVYLIAVDDDNWGNATGNKNKLSLPKNLLALRQDGTSESELLRKFFVAVTRAKVYLTMTNSRRNYAGKTPARLEYLNESTTEAGEVVSPFIPSGQVIKMTENINEAKQRTNLHNGWLAHYFELTPDLKKILLDRMKYYKMSATDLTSFIDIIYGGPAEFYKKKVLQAPAEPATTSLVLGNLVHATFEKVTKTKITDAEALDFCQEQIAELSLAEETQAELSQMAELALKKSLAKFAPIIRKEHAKAELDFYTEHLVYDEVPLVGKIDHINIDAETKTIEVYDFKTGKHYPGKWQTRNASLYKYKLQLGFYKLLLNLSPTYRKYTVTNGHILYVKPDEHGEVYDEVYQYNEKDEQELKKLIKVVYQRIVTLDYLDNPEINMQKDPTRSAKMFFDFVERLLEF